MEGEGVGLTAKGNDKKRPTSRWTSRLFVSVLLVFVVVVAVVAAAVAVVVAVHALGESSRLLCFQRDCHDNDRNERWTVENKPSSVSATKEVRFCRKQIR